MSKNDMLLIPAETLEVIAETLEEHDDRFDAIEHQLSMMMTMLMDIKSIVTKLQEAQLEKLQP